MTGTLIGYARCSTDDQDLAAQRAALRALGVAEARIYTDHGLSGTTRARPGLNQALAAVREGDTLVVPKLDRLARSVPDARAIADELAHRGVALALGRTVHDPTDPMGKMFFNVLATFAEFEADLIRLRTREGMAVARARGRLRGKPQALRAAGARDGTHARHGGVHHRGAGRAVRGRTTHRLPNPGPGEGRAGGGRGSVSMVLSTIGYEGATLAEVIETLRAAGVEVVMDVRAVAASRRAGFSKTILRASLEAKGIAYEHLRGLGTPKPGREAARKGRIAEMEAIFAEHMATPEARDGLARALALTHERHAALLCYEADAAGCHRRIVARLIRDATGCEVRDL